MDYFSKREDDYFKMRNASYNEDRIAKLEKQNARMIEAIKDVIPILRNDCRSRDADYLQELIQSVEGTDEVFLEHWTQIKEKF